MSDDILQYPYPLNLRWNHIYWLPIFWRRYLKSDFGVLADMDVRGAMFTLMAHSMDEIPPATLPLNAEIQALYLRIGLEEWRDLLQREMSPLHGWVKVQCGDETRLTHPLLLEGLEVAVKVNKLRQRGTTNRRRREPPDAGRAPR